MLAVSSSESMLGRWSGLAPGFYLRILQVADKQVAMRIAKQ